MSCQRKSMNVIVYCIIRFQAHKDYWHYLNKVQNREKDNMKIFKFLFSKGILFGKVIMSSGKESECYGPTNLDLNPTPSYFSCVLGKII